MLKKRAEHWVWELLKLSATRQVPTEGQVIAAIMSDICSCPYHSTYCSACERGDTEEKEHGRREISQCGPEAYTSLVAYRWAACE